MSGMQIISVATDGTISGLQRKPGQGIDLRQFGKATIVRASEIVWDEEAQAWTIQIADAPGLEVLKGAFVSEGLATSAGVAGLVREFHEAGKLARTPWVERWKPMLFREYDDAVAFEIAILDAWRVAGNC